MAGSIGNHPPSPVSSESALNHSGLVKRLVTPFREWCLIGVLVVANLVLAGFFASPVMRGRVPVHGDLGFFEIPLRNYYADCVREGTPFDWMPQIFCGYFISGEGQNGYYHPAHWLLYRWIPFDTAFALDVFLPMVVLAAGVIVFLRRYVDLASACMGSLAATFSWMFVMHMQQPQVTGVVAHIPWLLTAIAGAVSAPSASKRGLACVGIALLTASQVLLGHPQAMWFSMCTGALFAVFMLVGQRADWKAWVGIAGGILLGLGMGAIQLLPTYSVLATSTRVADDLKALAADAAPFGSFYQILAPYRAWAPYIGNYFGVAPLLLALWWITAFRNGSGSTLTLNGDQTTAVSPAMERRDRLMLQVTWWALVLVVLTAVLATGLRGKLYYLQLWLPVAGRIRGPFRYLIVTQFGVAILAALAFSRLLAFIKSGRKSPWWHLALPWLAFVASVVLAASDARGTGAFFQRGHFQNQCLTGPLFFGLGAWALTLAARARLSGLYLLAILTAVDLGLYSVTTPVGKIYWKNEVPRYEEYLAQAPKPPPGREGRIADYRWRGLPVANLYYPQGHRSTTGYVALWPMQQLDYQHINTLRVAEVAWCWQPPKPASSQDGLGPPDEEGWRQVLHPLPRVRLVSNVVVSQTPREDLKKIDVATTALVSRPVESSSSTAGTAKLIEDRPGKILIETVAPANQLLVVSESYDRGWRATVDQQPMPVERVNGDFMGCVVPAGVHQVQLVFDPISLRLGRIISLISLAFGLALGGVFMVCPASRWRRDSKAGNLPPGTT